MLMITIDDDAGGDDGDDVYDDQREYDDDAADNDATKKCIAALVAVSRKLNTAAKDVYYYDVANTNTKKASFGHFQTNEAALWLSIKSAQQDGSDYVELQKRHRESVKLMDGVVSTEIFVRRHTPKPPRNL